MLLLLKGRGLQTPAWHVDEPAAAGFSRVYFIEGGSTFYEAGGVRQELQQGCLYLFPASMPYKMRCSPENPLRCLWFHIDFFPAQVSALTVLSPKEDTVLDSYITLLQKSFAKGFFERESGQKSMEAFALYLTETYLDGTEQAMAPVISYIREHYRDSDLNVNALSARFGYTPEHFIRIFSKAFGITPYQYLLGMRMYEARRLLMTCSVKETAKAVGYDNPRTFSHAFEKKYAIPPGQYRKAVFPMI